MQCSLWHEAQFFVCNLHGLRRISLRRTQLNTIDYGNPLPRDLDPALLWPGPRADSGSAGTTTSHDSLLTVCEKWRGGTQNRAHRQRNPANQAHRGGGHREHTGQIPRAGAKKIPGFQDEPRLHLARTSVRFHTAACQESSSGFRSHSLRKSIHCVFRSCTCWHQPVGICLACT